MIDIKELFADKLVTDLYFDCLYYYRIEGCAEKLRALKKLQRECSDVVRERNTFYSFFKSKEMKSVDEILLLLKSHIKRVEIEYYNLRNDLTDKAKDYHARGMCKAVRKYKFCSNVAKKSDNVHSLILDLFNDYKGLKTNIGEYIKSHNKSKHKDSKGSGLCCALILRVLYDAFSHIEGCECSNCVKALEKVFGCKFGSVASIRDYLRDTPGSTRWLLEKDVADAKLKILNGVASYGNNAV